MDVTSEASWTSQNTSVATVDGDGLVRTFVSGVADIIAAVGSAEAKSRITVTDAEVIDLQIEPGALELPLGTSEQLTLTAFYSDGSSEIVTNGATWTSAEPTIASVSNVPGRKGLVSSKSIGSTSVRASFGGDSESIVVNVTGAVLEGILVEPADTGAPVGINVQYQAVGVYSDGSRPDITTSVSWRSSNTERATIDQTGMAFTHAAGAVTITATQDSVSGAASLNVTDAEAQFIEVRPPAVEGPIGTTVQLTATAVFTDGTREDVTEASSWASSAPDIVEVVPTGAGAGTLSLLADGTAEIQATYQSLDPVFTPVTVAGVILQSIDIEPDDRDMALGESQQYAATGFYSDGSSADITNDVTWRSSDSGVATITTSGRADGIALGETSISAALDGIDEETSLTVSGKIVTDLQILPPFVIDPSGTEGPIVVVARYSDNTVENVTGSATWSSADPNIASVTAGDGSRIGSYQLGEPGQTTFEAKFGGLSNTIPVTTQAAELLSIDVSPDIHRMGVGLEAEYVATGFYSDGSTATLTDEAQWSSSDSAVSIITDAGIATGLAPGLVTISATHDGVTGSALHRVIEAELVEIVIDPPQWTGPSGTTKPFTARGIYSDGEEQDITEEVNWNSTNIDSVEIKVDDPDHTDPVVAFLKEPGVATVSARLDGLVDTSDVTVTDPIVVDIFLEPYDESYPELFQVQFTALATYSNGDVVDITDEATWSSDRPLVAVPDQQGLVYTVNADPEPAGIRADFGGERGFAPINVVAATVIDIQIEPGVIDDPAGTRVQLQATAFYNNGQSEQVTEQSVWTSANRDIATVIAAGNLAGFTQLIAEGVTTISADFQGVVRTIDVTVTEAELVQIVVQPNDPSVPLGTAQQFEAIGYYSDGTSSPLISELLDIGTQNLTEEVVWTSSNTLVAGINEEGLATTLATGQTTIRADFEGLFDDTVLTVTEAVLERIEISPSVNVGVAGTTKQLEVTGFYSDTNGEQGVDITNDVDWASSSGFIATVSPGGLLSFNNVGDPGDNVAVLTATLDGVEGLATATTIDNELESIVLSPNPVDTPAGASVLVNATGFYTDGSSTNLNDEADWIISDAGVATVDNTAPKGLVTGIAAGSTTVFATVGELNGQATVNVTGAVLESIQITPAGVIGPSGTSVKLTATGNYSDGSNQNITNQVSWISVDPDTTFVDAVGSLDLLEQGATQVRAILDEIVDEIDVLVTEAVLESIEITPTDATIPKGTTLQYAATLNYSDGSYETVTAAEGLSWSSFSGFVASIDQAGLATGVRFLPNYFGEEAVITASKDGFSDTGTLKVTEPELIELVVAPTAFEGPEGSSRQLNALALYSDGSQLTVTELTSWQSSAPEIASVENCGALQGILCLTGTVNLLQAGDATITGTFEDASATSEVTVTAATLEEIVVTPALAEVAEGVEVQYLAEGKYSDGSTRDITLDVTWRSSDTGVATVDAAGLADTVGVGATNITASLDGQEDTGLLGVTPARIELLQVFPSTREAFLPGDLQQYTAQATYTNGDSADVTEQANWSVAPVERGNSSAEQAGLFQAGQVGSGVITAEVKLGLFDDPVTDTVDIEVVEPEIIGLEIDTGRVEGDPVELTEGIPEQWRAFAILETTDEDGNNDTVDVTLSSIWTSSNPDVAQVLLGIVNPKSAGPVQITAEYVPEDGSGGKDASFSDLEDMVQATVVAPSLLRLEISPEEGTTPVGGVVQFTAEAFYSNAPNDPVDVTPLATWDVEDDDIASISEGLAQGLEEGSTSITASLDGQSDTGLLNIEAITGSDIGVYPNVVDDRPGEDITMFKKAKFNYTAVVRFSDGTVSDETKNSNWDTSDKDIVKVKNDPANKGEVEAKDDNDPSFADITAEFENDNDDLISAVVRIEVDDSCEYNKKDYELQQMYIQPPDESIKKGQKLTLVAAGWYFKDQGEDCLAPVEDIDKNKDENNARERLEWEVIAGDSVKIKEHDGEVEVDGDNCGVSTIQATKDKTNTDGDGFDEIIATTTVTVPCDGGGGGGGGGNQLPELCEDLSNSDRPDTILVLPDGEEISPGDQLQLNAYGIYEAQNCAQPLADAQQNTIWTVIQGNSVSVDQTGLVDGRRDGDSTVEARFRGVRGTATVIVEN